MKGKIISLTFFLLSVVSTAFAKEKPVQYFSFKGTVFEHIVKTDDVAEASNVQIVVYQDKEIFVAFKTNETGKFLFEFPLGHQYEVVFGGEDFVNKKIDIDARQLKPKKEGYELDMDIRVFRPINGFDFAMLNEPFVKFNYDKEYGQFIPNAEYSGTRAKELDKILKKARKSNP